MITKTGAHNLQNIGESIAFDMSYNFINMANGNYFLSNDQNNPIYIVKLSDTKKLSVNNIKNS